MYRFLAQGVNYLLGKKLNKKGLFVGASLDYLDRQRSIDQNYFDYIRLSSLELACHEINKKQLKGSVAELGVYKGKFARYINLYFPDRKLYLFDTFEGFDPRDVKKEKNYKLSSGAQDFTNTSVDSVVSIMPYKENCIPVKGFFPESAKDIHDKYVFVSLDADLYEPIYAGLTFFYKDLVPGGYIFVHDFNNKAYQGVRKAVEQFCAEENISYVPLPDSAGSAVICK